MQGKNFVEYWFPTVFYTALDVVSEEENNKLIDAIHILKEKHESGNKYWNCDIYTTFNTYNIKDDETFSTLLSAIDLHVNNYIASVHSNDNLVCNSAWFNVGTVKQYQETHNHVGDGNKLSVIYYCSAPEGSATTIFKPPYEPTNPLTTQSLDSPLQKHVEFVAEERKLLIFPSYVSHLVPQGSNTKERISIATNYG